MSCRSNAGNSIITSMARSESGLSDMQTLHLFHRLMRQAKNYPEYTAEPNATQVALWKNQVRQQINAISEISESQRRRWVSQMERYEAEPLPSGPTFFAQRYLNSQVRESREALDQTYDRLGVELGLSPQQTKERVRQLEHEFAHQLITNDSGRQRSQRLGEEFFATLRQQLRPTHFEHRYINISALPQDKTTVYVLSQLSQQVAALPPHTVLDDNTSPTPAPARRRRLGQSRTPSQDSLTGVVDNNNSWQDWRTTNTRLTSAGINALNQSGLSDAQIGELLSTIETDMRQRWGANAQSFGVYPLPDNFISDALERRGTQAAPAPASLTATSPVQPQTDASQQTPTPNLITPSAQVTSANANTAIPATRIPAPKLAGPQGEVIYQQWVRELTAQRQAGGKPPYETENVLGEAATNFGVELEFRGADADKVARRLYEMGLSAHPEMVEYHHPRNPPCRVCQVAGPGKWKVERDGSVTDNSSGRNLGGEVVAPILSDTPQDWDQLLRVTQALQEEGAYVDHNTGQHIHVSTASYNNTSEPKQARAYRDLAVLVGGNEDLLFRMSAPLVGMHRGLVRIDHEAYHYTQPIAPRVEQLSQNPNPSLTDVLRPLGFYDRSPHSRHVPQAHYMSMNVQHVNPSDSTKSRVEFRTFNGTIDPGQIQTNVILAASLVHAAKPTTSPSPSPSPAASSSGSGQSGVDRTASSSSEQFIRASQPENPADNSQNSAEEWRGLGWHRQHRRTNEDSTHLRELVDRLNLSQSGAKALIDTFMRSGWQRVSRPSNRAEIEREVAAYSGVR